MSTAQIERQLTILFRRVQRIHLSTSTGELELDRSGYGIMCRLADEGAQRLSALAAAFGLDPSTITRQVQSLEQAGLVVREVDPSDRRASLLSLSDEGAVVLSETRQTRRQHLREAMGHWSQEEQEEFGRLLAKFNDSIDELVADLEG